MRIDTSAIEGEMKRLKKKDPALFSAICKKIKQIAELDRETINHFKNLRAPMNAYKRVHVGSFVLMFKAEGDIVIFGKFVHHDKAY